MNQKRAVAGIIDFFICCIIQTFLMSFFFILPSMNGSISNDALHLSIRMVVISYCSISYLVFRDVIGSKSVGKRLMRLKIVNKINGENAVFSKRLIRNLTFLLTWIDIIAFIILKERIGDKIAATDVKEI